MSDIEQLEQNIKDAEELVELKKMAMKLADNYEFRKLFLEDYFVNEAARLVQLSADPIIDAAKRADALAMAQATGHCKRYLSVIVTRGSHFEQELPALRAGLDELRAESHD